MFLLNYSFKRYFCFIVLFFFISGFIISIIYLLIYLFILLLCQFQIQPLSDFFKLFPFFIFILFVIFLFFSSFLLSFLPSWLYSCLSWVYFITFLFDLMFPRAPCELAFFLDNFVSPIFFSWVQTNIFFPVIWPILYFILEFLIRIFFSYAQILVLVQFEVLR